MDAPLRLTPGLYVVPRGRDRVQVGLIHHSEVLPATDPRIAELRHHALSATHDWSDLEAAGVVTRGPVPSDALGRRLARDFPHDWSRRLQRRREAVVRVLGEAGIDPRPWLEGCGISLYDATRTPQVVLVLGTTLPDPTLLAMLTRADIPHLLLTFVEGNATIGPFVLPGQTACAECLEMHAAEDDPERPEVVRRMREAQLADGDPVSIDPALASQAIAWAVRDVVGHVDGDTPSTWSATIRLGPAGGPELTTWMRHPECGCGWAMPADRGQVAG